MDKLKYLAITPNLLMSLGGEVLLEKEPDDKHFYVNFYHTKLNKKASRLFYSESEADFYINYLIGEDGLSGSYRGKWT